MSIVGTALAVGSGLVSLFGSLKSAEANKGYDKYLDNRLSDLDKWYNTEYNTPYLDTTAGRSAVGSLRTYYGDAMKKVSQNNAITGASDEAKVATGDKVQRGLSDSIMRLAGHGTMYRDSIRREYQNLKFPLENMKQQSLANKSQNWTNLMSNAMNLGIAGAEAGGNGAFEGTDNWLKNLLNGGGGAVSNPLGNMMLQGNANNARIDNIFNR